MGISVKNIVVRAWLGRGSSNNPASGVILGNRSKKVGKHWCNSCYCRFPQTCCLPDARLPVERSETWWPRDSDAAPTLPLVVRMLTSAALVCARFYSSVVAMLLHRSTQDFTMERVHVVGGRARGLGDGSSPVGPRGKAPVGGLLKQNVKLAHNFKDLMSIGTEFGQCILQTHNSKKNSKDPMGGEPPIPIWIRQCVAMSSSSSSSLKL